MAEGNGIDLGSIYGLLVEVGKTVSRHDAMLLGLQDELRALHANMATKGELAAAGNGLKSEINGLKTEMNGLKADVNGLKGELAELRQEVRSYHATVMGHGILISELDHRMLRVEDRLGLPPATHG